MLRFFAHVPHRRIAGRVGYRRVALVVVAVVWAAQPNLPTWTEGRCAPRVCVGGAGMPMPEEAAMAKPWRCRLRLHRLQRIRSPDGQWYRECRDCGTELIDRYKEGPPPTAIG